MDAEFLDFTERLMAGGYELDSVTRARLISLARRGAEAADTITRLTARVAELEGALTVCDRVLHFDLRRMIEWGDDYNQAVKDAADVARAALERTQHERT